MGLLGNNQNNGQNLFSEIASKSVLSDIASVVLIGQTQLYGRENSWGLSFDHDPLGSPIVMSQNVPKGTELTFSVTFTNGKIKIMKAKAGSPLGDRLLQLAMDPNVATGREKSASNPRNIEHREGSANNPGNIERREGSASNPGNIESREGSGGNPGNTDAPDAPDVSRTENTQSSTTKPKNGKKLIQLQKNQLPNGKYIIGKDIPVGIYDFTWVYGSGHIELYLSDKNTTLGNLDYDGGYIGDQYDYQNLQCFHVDCKENEMLVIGGNLVVEISRSKKIELDL